MTLYDPQVLAYLAGCMDSDGSFTIRRDTRSMSTTGRTPTHIAVASLRQVTPQVPDLLYETFGGYLGITKSTAVNGRPLFGWTAQATKATEVCRVLIPHLRIKAGQAQALIDLHARKGPGGRKRITDEELRARDELALLVQRLDKTGVAA